MGAFNFVDELRKISGAQPGMPEVVTLRDGTRIKVRPIQPDDAPRLQMLATRLSPESIYRRFLTSRRVLLDEEAERLVDVDYQSQMALVATSEQAGEEGVIAVARYAALQLAQPDVVEAAIIVEDHYQSKGLGMLLLVRLVAYARAHGVRSFVATYLQNNTPIIQLINRSGLAVESKKLESSMWEVKLSLDIPGLHESPPASR
jgi:L-amino acid N-acyltransferase YncA